MRLGRVRACALHTVRVRRSGRYANADGATEPNWEIRDFFELRRILVDEFGVQ